MLTQGLLVRLQAREGQDQALEERLRHADAQVAEEPATAVWFALRFGRGDFGLFDAFHNEAGRDAHLRGPLLAGLCGPGAQSLLAGEPALHRARVLACKLPPQGEPPPPISRGLLLTFRARQGEEAQVENLLRGAELFVQQEPATVAWFALRLEDGQHAIFDVFPDNAGRLAHLAGHVPRELVKHAALLLGGVPDMAMLHVLAARFAPRPTVVGLGVD